MKIIFLDHDGVICLSTEWGGRHKKQREYGRKMSQTVTEMPVEVRFDNFNKKAVKVLNEIIKETDAEIVVSSDWKRWATVEEMGEFYESKGIIKKPIAFTKYLNECEYEANFPWAKPWDLEQCRSIEIKQYLKEHPEITHWVAIDDLDMGTIVEDKWDGPIKHPWGLTNFVLTPRSLEGIKQCGIKEKVLEFLK